MASGCTAVAGRHCSGLFAHALHAFQLQQTDRETERQKDRHHNCVSSTYCGGRRITHANRLPMGTDAQLLQVGQSDLVVGL